MCFSPLFAFFHFTFSRATLGQGIRNGKSVIPITGPGGLQQQSQNHQQHSIDRRMNFSNTNCSGTGGSSLRVSIH
jgi:hypothetical protein